ncbi:hypothetical protein FB451DRAFT_1202933 [Mycena latifolia]|nr:hypothetical protein FB451DRAFT_1202933 [Mycena latifolia]
MLSSLRVRLRPTRPFAPSTRSFSASTPVHNDNSDNSSNNEMADLLNNQAERTPPPIHQPKSSTNRPVHEYKPIHPNSFIRPYDISLEGRAWQQRPLTRRPNVAPATRDARKKDVFYQLGIDPLKFSLHPGVLSHFMSEMAMIYPRRQTGLTMKSQRRVAKAIRRAKMMGVMPLHSRMHNYGESF